MELRHLRYFAAVFAEGSISRAAERLLISQPALTRQIRALEREIGIPLFDRVSSGVRPTPAGSALHAHALQVIRLADRSREVARSAGPVKERVDIGLAPGIAQHRLRSMLDRIREQVPRADVTFVDAGSAEQLRMIAEGRLDVGLLHQNPPATLLHTLLFAQPFGVALRPGHHLAGRPACPLRDLDDLRVLAHAREQVPAEHDRMVVAAHEVGVTPRWAFARFTENALMCAEASDADAVLLSASSAARLLPDWPWSRLVDPEVLLRTWMVRPPVTRAVVAETARALEPDPTDAAQASTSQGMNGTRGETSA